MNHPKINTSFRAAIHCGARRAVVPSCFHYNVPTLYRGVTHTDVCLTFENGRIVEATSNATDKLNEVFDTDEGARYVGEFALGFNPFCTKPMKDILFDEKIAGSIHFTPGSCYDEASNGNHSAIHWDLVLRQDSARTRRHEGGEDHEEEKQDEYGAYKHEPSVFALCPRCPRQRASLCRRRPPDVSRIRQCPVVF